MSKLIDARGDFNANLWALMERGLENLPKEDSLSIMVDNIASANALEAMAKRLHMVTRRIKHGSDYVLSFYAQGPVIFPEFETLHHPEEEPLGEDLVVVIDKKTLGSGDMDFGEKLMKKYLSSLTCLSKLPKSVIFINSGVKLLAPHGYVASEIQNLRDLGVKIYACGSSLDFYRISYKGQQRDFSVLNMLDIVSILAGPNKVLKI